MLQVQYHLPTGQVQTMKITLGFGPGIFPDFSDWVATWEPEDRLSLHNVAEGFIISEFMDGFQEESQKYVVCAGQATCLPGPAGILWRP